MGGSGVSGKKEERSAHKHCAVYKGRMKDGRSLSPMPKTDLGLLFTIYLSLTIYKSQLFEVRIYLSACTLFTHTQ